MLITFVPMEKWREEAQLPTLILRRKQISRNPILKDQTRHKARKCPYSGSSQRQWFKEMVYNDFYIGEDSDVVIVAGCGIHN